MLHDYGKTGKLSPQEEADRARAANHLGQIAARYPSAQPFEELLFDTRVDSLRSQDIGRAEFLQELKGRTHWRGALVDGLETSSFDGFLLFDLLTAEVLVGELFVGNAAYYFLLAHFSEEETFDLTEEADGAASETIEVVSRRIGKRVAAAGTALAGAGIVAVVASARWVQRRHASSRR